MGIINGVPDVITEREREKQRGEESGLCHKDFYVLSSVVLDELSMIVLDEKVHGYHSLRLKYSVIACLG